MPHFNTITCFGTMPFAEVVGFGELVRVMAMRSRDTRRRVKLYILNDDLQWEDKGTGHVTIASGSGMAEWMWPVLCVRSEEDGKHVAIISVHCFLWSRWCTYRCMHSLMHTFPMVHLLLWTCTCAALSLCMRDGPCVCD